MKEVEMTTLDLQILIASVTFSLTVIDDDIDSCPDVFFYAVEYEKLLKKKGLMESLLTKLKNLQDGLT